MSGLLTGRVSKPRREQRVKNRSVLRMMAIMQDGKSEEVPKEFLETGRTGRRNAMPNVLHPQGAEVSTADLPSRLQQLVTTDTDVQPSTSSTKQDLAEELKEDPPEEASTSCS